LLKLLLFLVLLAALAGLVYLAPYLWELAIAGLIGGIYRIFFHQPGNNA
jgi:hypothetical protein